MSFWISKVAIEGTRGINQGLELDFGTGMNIIFGPNGTGKSSVLQSIEWCLTGNMFYPSGEEFKKEDGIVNLFQRNKLAKVIVTLTNGARTLVVSRTRKMGKSTYRGLSQLEARDNGKVFIQEEAQRYLNKVLSFSPEDFPRSHCLHQESIQELLSAAPEVRSKGIDRLLGLVEVREFLEATDVERKIDARIRALNKEIQTVERDKIQFAIRTREVLAEEKKALEAQGYSEQELTLDYIAKEVANLIRGLKDIAKSLGTEEPALVLPQPDVGQVKTALEKISETIKSLDRFRITAFQRQAETVNKATTLEGQFTEAKEEVEKFRPATVETLLDTKQSLGGQLETAKQLLSDLTRKLTQLTIANDRIQTINAQVSSLKSELAAIEAEHDDEAKQLASLEKLSSQLNETRKNIEGFSLHEKLMSSALDFLKLAKADRCPVCAQPIDPVMVTRMIESEAKPAAAKRLAELKEHEKEIRSALDASRTVLDRRRQIESTIKKEEERILQVRTDLEQQISHPVGEDTAQLLGDFKKEHEQLSEQQTSLSNNLLQIDQKYNALLAACQRHETAQKDLQRVVGTAAEEQELIGLLRTKLKDATKTMDYLKDTTTIDALSGKLSRTRQAFDYLSKVKEAEQREKQLPELNQLVQNLNNRVSSSNLFKGAINAIREAGSRYQKEAAVVMLSSLENEINSHYSLLEVHPYFAKLKVDIEREHPLLYSLKATGTEQSTYVPTRFSNAQINLVGIALFFANSSKAAGEARIALLDDPSQSLDSAHKRALTRALERVTEDRQVILATQDEELRNEIDKVFHEKAHSFTFGAWSTDGPTVERLQPPDNTVMVG